MKQTVIDMLRCPVCHAAVTADEFQKVCHCRGVKTHCFDFSKSGYLNLTASHAGEGDQKQSVQARRRFLDMGYYSCLSDTVNSIIKDIPSNRLLDAGCGEGYYTNRMAIDRSVLGVDLSKDGIDMAAKRAKADGNGAGYIVSSVYALPVQDSSVDVITNIFAPCAEEEYSRALKSEGHLLVVGAGEQHLMGLKRLIYDDPYINQTRADIPKNMILLKQLRLQKEIEVIGRDMIDALFSMTPYYWRTSAKDRGKLAAVDRLTTELDFDIYLFRKRT